MRPGLSGEPVHEADRYDPAAWPAQALLARAHDHRTAALMIGFGIFLLIVAALKPQYHVLGRIGGLCIIIGLILALLGTLGYAVGGRRHYY